MLHRKIQSEAGPGIDPKDARVNRGRADEEVIDMGSIAQDIRFGIRGLVKPPRFTMAAIVTLGLGIRANAARSGAIHPVLLKAWPFPGIRRPQELDGAR